MLKKVAQAILGGLVNKETSCTKKTVVDRIEVIAAYLAPKEIP